jgi:hypothetical protein
MVQYTKPELTDMMIVYGEALSNNAEASVYTFVNAVQDNNTFSPINRDRDRSRSRTVLDLEREILQAVEEEPNVSCRRLAQGMSVSSFTIWRTQNERRLHPHHLQSVQHLKLQDRRIAFCQWLLQKICEKPNLLHIVLTTDEAGFTRDGVFSLH